MLLRDDPSSCHVLSGDHNIYHMRGRLQLVRIAVLLYRILNIQQTQLPSDVVPLGSEIQPSSGTQITAMEDYVVKRVDLQKQPYLRHQLSELQEMYTATKGSQHLIQSETGSTVRIKYTVILSPYGDRLGNGYLSTRIRSTMQLQAAIRCILLAPKDLHAADFAHTDIRWSNLIKCSDDVFCLIDLVAAVRLGCQWDFRKHGPIVWAGRRKPWSTTGTQLSQTWP